MPTKWPRSYHYQEGFTGLILDRRNDIDVFVVKMRYLGPRLFGLAADKMLALTPGGADHDLVSVASPETSETDAALRSYA